MLVIKWTWNALPKGLHLQLWNGTIVEVTTLDKRQSLKNMTERKFISKPWCRHNDTQWLPWCNKLNHFRLKAKCSVPWLLLCVFCFKLIFKFLFPSQGQIQRDGKSVRQISFASVNLVNTGEYTCHAKNGALDGKGDVIEVKETTNLFVRCKFPNALCVLC